MYNTDKICPFLDLHTKLIDALRPNDRKIAIMLNEANITGLYTNINQVWGAPSTTQFPQCRVSPVKRQKNFVF